MNVAAATRHACEPERQSRTAALDLPQKAQGIADGACRRGRRRTQVEPAVARWTLPAGDVSRR